MAEKPAKVQTMLDPTVDGDIIEWYRNIPQSRRGEFVRTAIRLYMAQTGKGNGVLVAAGNIEERSYAENKI